ncbi:DNA-3-methyladenine glycosylase [Desertihabitans aurantiacus]|uniref:DNA-3-methyladenine glycosylase n=1 Tax=Desertihabitans aurantiacus TaxID=2282477 RepID=UPI000DF762CD|nr:DNA-3-methyladenine glycosylase [Desertihabitans aurantiacus]
MTASRPGEPPAPADEPDVLAAARGLLGAVLHGHGVSVRLTEVEAYAGPDDPASHAFRRTPRSETMYGPAGRLYLYRSYGIHLCANVVTGEPEQGQAVLLRAGEVVAGHELARERRGVLDDVRLARGPGNLCSALGLVPADLGADLEHDPPPRLELGTPVDPARVLSGPRVGVSLAADRPWRFWLAGDPTVSAYRRSPRAPASGAGAA